MWQINNNRLWTYIMLWLLDKSFKTYVQHYCTVCTLFHWQDKHGHFVVLTNLLYKKDRLTRMFTWRTPFSTNPWYSATLNMKSKSEPETKGLTMKQSAPTPDLSLQLFPDKTKNLQGSTLNVSTVINVVCTRICMQCNRRGLIGWF